MYDCSFNMTITIVSRTRNQIKKIRSKRSSFFFQRRAFVRGPMHFTSGLTHFFNSLYLTVKNGTIQLASATSKFKLTPSWECSPPFLSAVNQPRTKTLSSDCRNETGSLQNDDDELVRSLARTIGSAKENIRKSATRSTCIFRMSSSRRSLHCRVLLFAVRVWWPRLY